MNQIMATKRGMKQAWTTAGKRIPVTVLYAKDCYVVSDKANAQDRVLVGAGVKKLKNTHKPQKTLLEKAGLSVGLRKFVEMIVSPELKESMTPGTQITPGAILAVGDIVKVTGETKGKGFTGVVKRYNFRGGPRTHGQSDRERARGSLGSGTTPGRVFKQKRMAGRHGTHIKTIEGLQVIHIDDASGQIMIRGIIPGTMNSLVTITKVSEGKFDGLIENPVLGMQKTVVETPVVEEVVTPETQTESQEA